MTKILIGIPTHKRRQLLRKTLESIARQENVEKFDIRVFVADNDISAQDGVKLVEEMAPTFRFPITARVVEERGISAVRNQILREASEDADFVAMIDDDEVATAFWIECLIEVQARTGADVIGGAVEYSFDTPPSRSLRHSKAFWHPHYPSGPIDFISGTTNVMICCDTLRKLNWPAFDNAFGLTGGGDKEWFTRLKKKGATFAWASFAITVETVPAERATSRWALRRNFRIGVDDVRISSMHDGPITVARKTAEALAILITAPLALPVFILPWWRLRMMRRWTRALGRLNALFGRHYQEYAIRHE